MSTKYHDLIENFSLLSESIDKFSYLIDLGKESNGIPQKLKTEQNLVKGCSSLAWVVCRKNKNNKYEVCTDSDAFIVKGLLVLLENAVSGLKKNEIEQLETKNILRDFGLSHSITSQRLNGFGNALQRIKESL
tara:strand:- start:138 stop:536 length:399 start_codon:yes stop_codon:yes gene_type:complete